MTHIVDSRGLNQALTGTSSGQYAPKGNQHAYKHGRFLAKAIARRREISALIRAARALGGKAVV
jgi:hypothetical protein